MAALDQQILDALNNLNSSISAMNNNRGNQSGGGSGRNAPDSSYWKNLAGGIDDATTSALKFGTGVFSGSARVSDGVKALTDTAGGLSQIFGNVLPGPLRAFGEKLSGATLELVKAVEGGVDTFRHLSVSGVSFNNNILEMKNAAAQSRLTLDEFADVVKTNSQGFAAFGGTATRGAQLFSKASKDMFDKGLANPLLNMGMTFKDINEDLAEYIVQNRRRFTDQQIADGTAARSAVAMATEMDKIAKLTGKNRKDMEKEIQTRMRKGQVDAKIRLLEASGNKEAADKMRRALAEAEKAGPGALAAVEDLFTKGAVVSEEGRQAAVALGPAFNDLTNMVNYAKGPGGIEGMGQSINSFNTAVANRINDPNFLQMATLGGMGNGFADAAAGLVSSAGTYADNVNKVARGTGDTASAVEALNASARAEQEARNATTQTVIQGERALRDMGAAINEQLIGRNGALTRFQENLSGVATSLENLRRGDMDPAAVAARDALNTLAGQEDAPTPARDAATTEITQANADTVKSVNNAVMALSDGDAQAQKALASLASIDGQLASSVANFINEEARENNRTIEEQIALMTDGVNAQGQQISDFERVMEIVKAAAGTLENANEQSVRLIEAAVRAQAAGSQTVTQIGRASNATVDQMTRTPVGARAGGGPVSAGQPYLVGEEGPELFYPKANGQIIPKDMSNAMIGMNSAMQTMSAAPGPDFSSLEMAIKEMTNTMQSEMQKMAQNPAIQEGMKGLADMLSTKMDENKDALTQLHTVARKQVGAIKSQGLDVFARNVLG